MKTGMIQRFPWPLHKGNIKIYEALHTSKKKKKKEKNMFTQPKILVLVPLKEGIC